MAKYIEVKYLGKCETCKHRRYGKCDTWCDHGEAYLLDMYKVDSFGIEGEVRKPCEHCDIKNYLKDIWDGNKLHHILAMDEMGNSLNILHYIKENKYYLHDNYPTYIKFEISHCPCCGRSLR